MEIFTVSLFTFAVALLMVWLPLSDWLMRISTRRSKKRSA